MRCTSCNKKLKLKVNWTQTCKNRNWYICSSCIKDYYKEYYSKNKDKYRKASSKWAKKYPDKIRALYCRANRKRYKKYRNQVKEENRIYRLNNKEKLNKYFRNLYASNINYKIARNLRVRVWEVLKGIRKSSSTFKLLGCSLSHLKKCLERKFTSRMNWDNYGTYWEMDHIKPCALFNLVKPSEQRNCFNYKNLQPLTLKQNRSKGSRVNRKRNRK